MELFYIARHLRIFVSEQKAAQNFCPARKIIPRASLSYLLRRNENQTVHNQQLVFQGFHFVLHLFYFPKPDASKTSSGSMLDYTTSATTIGHESESQSGYYAIAGLSKFILVFH